MTISFTLMRRTELRFIVVKHWAILYLYLQLINIYINDRYVYLQHFVGVTDELWASVFHLLQTVWFYYLTMYTTSIKYMYVVVRHVNLNPNVVKKVYIYKTLTAIWILRCDLNILYDAVNLLKNWGISLEHDESELQELLSQLM